MLDFETGRPYNRSMTTTTAPTTPRNATLPALRQVFARARAVCREAGIGDESFVDGTTGRAGDDDGTGSDSAGSYARFLTELAIDVAFFSAHSLPNRRRNYLMAWMMEPVR
jgi:hypothetical protein